MSHVTLVFVTVAKVHVALSNLRNSDVALSILWAILMPIALLPSAMPPISYTGLGRGPYGGRHLGSCPPFWPQFQARGWTSTTFAHCKLTYFIFIIAYDCFRNPSSTKLNIFLYFCLHNVLLIFS